MQFDWWTLLLQIVNFLILVWLLRRFLYKPVQAVIAKRKAMADSALADAEARRSEAQAEKAQLEAAQAEFAGQRKALIEAAQQEANAKRKAVLEEAERKAHALIVEGRAEAAKAREAEVGALKGELAETAVTIARAILAGTAEQGLDAVFRARILKDLDALAAEKGSQAGAGGSVRVVTAAPLAEPERQAWSDALQARGFDAAKIEFATDAALVAGAELRLPRGDLRFAWADQLKEAQQLMSAPRAAE